MAYLPGSKNDVFISYAHVDNLEDIDGQRSVTLIVRQLRLILQQRLSRDGVKVYWDNSDLGANKLIDEALLDEVRGSGVLIALVSPAYLSGRYTIAELEAFLAMPDAQDRLFILELLPARANDPMHPGISARKRFQFWRNTGEGGVTPMTLDPRLNREMYMTALTGFSDQVRDRLVGLHTTQTGTPSPGGAASAKSAKPMATVLLTQTTDDLDYEREQVRSALQQYNIHVLPELEYPQGGAEFRTAYAEDLARADLVVQLLSAAAGRMPADMPNGYLWHQAHAAREANVPLLAWRHPDLDAGKVSNPVHRDLVTGPDVVASGLESFKSMILKRIEELKAEPRQVRSSLIFIGADRSDMPLAEELLQALSRKGLPVAVPIYEGSPEDIQRDLEENLVDSDSVLFVHGAAPTTWVRGFLRRLSRSMAVRSEPPYWTGMVKAPPPKAEGVNHTFPNLQVIDCSDGFDVDRIVTAMESRL